MKMKLKNRLIRFIIATFCILLVLGYLIFHFIKPNFVDLTSVSEKDLYFPLLNDILKEEDSYAINANAIAIYSAVVDEEGNPIKNIKVVILDSLERELCTLVTDENGFVGISGLASTNQYFISLGSDVETFNRITYQVSTKNNFASTYRTVFVVTSKKYSSLEYEKLKDKYIKNIFKNVSTPTSIEFQTTYNNWNYMSGCYYLKQKDLIGTKIYINSRKHEFDNQDKTNVNLERKFTITVSDAEVLDYNIIGLKTNPSIKIFSKNNEIVVTNYDKKNINSYLGKLIVTFKKDGVIYKVSKIIDLFANVYVNSIIDMTITKNNEVLRGGTIIIERLSTGTSVSYQDRREYTTEDGFIQINASSGTYKVTKLYNGEILDTLLFTVRNNESQTIVF